MKRGPDVPDPVSNSLAGAALTSDGPIVASIRQVPRPAHRASRYQRPRWEASLVLRSADPRESARLRRPTDRVGYFLARFAFFAFFFLPFFLAAIRTVLVRVWLEAGATPPHGRRTRPVIDEIGTPSRRIHRNPRRRHEIVHRAARSRYCESLIHVEASSFHTVHCRVGQRRERWPRRARKSPHRRRAKQRAPRGTEARRGPTCSLARRERQLSRTAC